MAQTVIAGLRRRLLAFASNDPPVIDVNATYNYEATFSSNALGLTFAIVVNGFITPQAVFLSDSGAGSGTLSDGDDIFIRAFSTSTASNTHEHTLTVVKNGTTIYDVTKLATHLIANQFEDTVTAGDVYEITYNLA